MMTSRYHNLLELPSEESSATSRAAAASMQKAAATLRERVFAFILSRGAQGATDDELEVELDMRHQTASARRRELDLAGRIRKTEKVRPTRSGRNAAVYVVV